MKIKLLILCLLAIMVASCGYQSEPPLTEGASSTYVLPAGEMPSAEERAMAEQAKQEYENYIK